MTPPDVFALLRRLIDGDGGHVTKAEAMAVHALVWDARQEADKSRRAREVAK